MSPRALHTVVTLTAALAFMFLTGCASSGAPVTGSRDRTRTVSVGNEVIIRLPASTTSPEWRLASFDSLKMTLTSRPRLVEAESNGEREWVARFIARVPGQVDIEFRRVAAGPNASGPIGERKRFRFRIRE